MISSLRRATLFSVHLAPAAKAFHSTPSLNAIRMASSMPNSGMQITDWVDPKNKTGEFLRGQSQFRRFISKENGAQFPPEKGRYHLYVSYGCPWAHRTLIVRKLKGLEDIISFTSVHWHMKEKGWHFKTPEEDDAQGENVTADPLEGHEKFTHLRDVYFGVDPEYKGRFTVPVLYDKKNGTIVSNESSEIIRMFYSEFDDLLTQKYKDVVLYPEALRKDIDEANEWIYDTVNNGVYKAGFATKQEAYEKNLYALFDSLDRIEKHLATSEGPYYLGKKITEVDVRLYTTIVRFDPIYHQHFKTNIRDIRSGYFYIHKWLRNLYWNNEAFGSTTDFDHIKKHYSKSHLQINPFSITPIGPLPNILKEDEEVAAVKGALSK